MSLSLALLFAVEIERCVQEEYPHLLLLLPILAYDGQQAHAECR